MHNPALNPIEIAERLTRVEEAIRHNTEATTRLEHALLGNGKPGAIPKLKKRVRVLEYTLAIAIGGFLGDKGLPYVQKLLRLVP